MEAGRNNTEVIDNYGLEINSSQKETYYKNSSKVKTMESFTERFRVECVVEQVIMESERRESLANSESCKKEVEGNMTTTHEESVLEESSEETNQTESEEVCPKVNGKQNDSEIESPLHTKDDSDLVLEDIHEPENLVSNLSESIKPIDSTENDICSVRVKNGRSVSFGREESLYPNVVVKSENDGKEIEAIECKEIKRKGSKFSSYSPESGSRKGSSASYIEKDIETILADVKATLIAVEGTPFTKEASELRVAVIGAGPAGLCAARHLVTQGINAEVYEQCANIGGTWVYNEDPHTGPHAFPLHSSLYHDLWTNLPKETMQYPDFPYKEEGFSYLPSEKVLQYLIDYADHFNLHPIIKVKHLVKSVAPLGQSWSLTVEDLIKKQEEVSLFDAVMVCSGPNTIPVYPSIEGIAKFSGKQLHSRDYRRAETYTGKRVLIVGLGPSGLDITYQLQPTAKQVYLSHNMTKEPGITFPESIMIKPKVKSLFDKTVTFEDNSTEDVDVIIYCTGYTYNFPFFTKECGLIVDQNVGPLYKHLINIEHPTMCIIGLPKYCPHQYMVDYQVRAYLNILLGQSKLPPKEEMLEDLENERKVRLLEGQRKKDFHKLGKGRTKQYMDDLTELGNLEPVAPVMYKLFAEAFIRAIRDFKGFRKFVYKIVDNENFSVEEKEIEEKSI